MKSTFRMLIVACLYLAGAGAWAQTATTNNKPADTSMKQADTLPPSAVGPSYVIGANDVLLVSVWKEQELTNTVPVRPDGNISLPLLNDVHAAGLTPTQLSADITAKLKKFVADPRVTVVVKEVNSQRIYVVGEVQHNGALQLLPDMTVLQALSEVGFTQFANTKGIYVLRVENGKETKIPVNYKKLIKGKTTDQNIPLKVGDTIVVP
ncbi:MAG TPA: polysaccharide biosynthesis/export family protein [Terriglobales bacterium]